MARFVIANRRAGRFTAEAKVSSRVGVAAALANVPFDKILNDTDPPDPLARRVVVVEADPVELVARAAVVSPDVIIEPEILHWPDAVPPRDLRPLRRADAGVPMRVLAAQDVLVSVTGAGAPLANAAVRLYARGLGGTEEFVGRTDQTGTARFQITLGSVVAAVLVLPAGGYWAVVSRGEVKAPIDCPPLPTDGPLGWWHDVLGIAAAEASAGAGIRIGVVDTGCGPHRNLHHVTPVGAFVDGEVLEAIAASDVDAHGTHVAGTIGARPTDPGDYAGIAPGAALYAARVFRGPEAGASNADIANAIDALSRGQEVDLINLSLGSTRRSLIVEDAVADAAERGTLCVCAAGNDAKAINYPAALPEAVAVTTVGLAGWGPPGTLSGSRLPSDPALFGLHNLYAASFTSHGPEADATAPGVGIIATVPNHFGGEPLHAAMDGTSMASPVVCAALAVVLSRTPAYRALPRDVSRSNAARSLLNGMLRDIGLPPSYQGRGLPSLVPLVG